MTELRDVEAILLYRDVIAELSANGRTARYKEIEELLEAPLSSTKRSMLLNLLTHIYFSAQAFEPALAACHRWLEVEPHSSSAKESLLSILMRLRRFDELIERGLARIPQEPDNFRLFALLADAYGRSGQADEARAMGKRALEIKDCAVTGEPHDLAAIPVPRFDTANRKTNVISFSLFGAAPKYCDGAVRNVEVAAILYPEWTCRFHIDASVPVPVRRRLLSAGAQVKVIEDLPAGRFGTLWRVLVADDPSVERYLVRDCDSCVNLRERAAVDDWIASGRHFHVMRDGLTHSELMLAGMWGGVRAALPPLKPQIEEFGRKASLSRTADQTFLRERLWATVRTSALVHDSQFGFGSAIAFPERSNIPGMAVGS